jgi:hypothetical protein
MRGLPIWSPAFTWLARNLVSRVNVDATNPPRQEVA